MQRDDSKRKVKGTSNSESGIKTLKRSAMRNARLKQLEKQEGLCDLCGRKINEKSSNPSVIDHDHETMLCRGVIHRNCNTAEGKVRRAARFSGMSRTDYLISLGKYLEKYKKHPRNVRYPDD